MDKKRINFFCTQEVFEDIDALSKKLGINHPRVVQLAVTAGISALKVAINPDWADALEVIGEDLDKVGIKKFIPRK